MMRVTFGMMKRLGVAAGLGAAAGAALAAQTLPPIEHDGSVAYLTGGIGEREVKAIERVSAQWPVTLEFAEKAGARGDFVADVEVDVRDAKTGRASLQTTSDGPFVLARLAPGRYVVDATLDGKTLHDRLVVRKGSPAKAIFVWPAGTDNVES